MKVNSNLSVLFWLNGKLSKDGKKHLYARLTIEGVRAEVSMGEQVDMALWDQELGRLSDSSRASMLTNKRIEEARVKFQKHYDLLEYNNPIVTPDLVKAEFLGIKREKKTLIEVLDFVIDKFQKKVDKGLRAKASLVKWKTTKKKIENFLAFQFKRENIDLSKIVFAFAEDFMDYLTLEEGVVPNTASKYIKNLKHLLKTGVERNWISHNAIQGYKCSYIHPDRDILNAEELVTLYQKEFRIDRLREVRDCYLFMCFTGFAYKDARLLSRDYLVKYFDGEDWIMKNREKTGDQRSHFGNRKSVYKRGNRFPHFAAGSIYS